MITRMWAGQGTGFSCCRQSERGNGTGRTPSGRRTVERLARSVHNLDAISAALVTFLWHGGCSPLWPLPIHLSRRSPLTSQVILGNPSDRTFSHCAGMKELLPRSPLPCRHHHQPFLYLPHLFMLSCCLPSQSFHLMSNYCS